jgi:chromosome segregation ATPase
MTLADFIPVLSGKPRPRKANRIETKLRKAQEHLAAVREDNAKLLDWQAAADDFFTLQDQYLTSLKADLAAEAQRRGQIEEALASYQADLDEVSAENQRLTDELLALRARFGPQIAAEINANRVDVPRMQRIGADQETAARGIDVHALWEARDAGLLGPITAIPNPNAADPTRTH